MKTVSVLRRHYLYLFLAILLFITLPLVVALADDTIAEGSQAPLPLGRVTVLGEVKCPQGATTGATCTSISVSCPGLSDLNGTLSETSPTGTARGTVVLANGGGGTTFFNAGFASAYINAGFRVAQFLWTTDWEDTGGIGLKSAACRSATIFRYFFYFFHHADLTTGFCAQGTSGGGGAIGYSLAQYGLANYFDYLLLSGGPGVSRMDYGCDTSLYTGGTLNLCPLLTDARYAYPGGTQINGWENTTSCQSKQPLQIDIDKWAADSIVTSGGNYNYPKTGMSWYFCVTPPANNSTGQGKFLIDQVHPKNVPDVSCYSGVCKSELVWQDKTAFNAMVAEMTAQCVPNHQ